MFRRRQGMSQDEAIALVRQGFVGSPSPVVIAAESRAVLREAKKRGEGVWRCNCINPHAPMPRYHLLSEEACSACGMKQSELAARDAEVAKRIAASEADKQK